jgi:hypothetical protein
LRQIELEIELFRNEIELFYKIELLKLNFFAKLNFFRNEIELFAQIELLKLNFLNEIELFKLNFLLYKIP